MGLPLDTTHVTKASDAPPLCTFSGCYESRGHPTRLTSSTLSFYRRSMALDTKRYTIREAAELTGLPASTLRYYETIGIIDPIGRRTSGHRTYSQDDIDLIDGIACLSATGMAIPEMREYLAHRLEGAAGAAQEIALLERQQEILRDEAARVQQRQEYVAAKIAYWAAVRSGDDGLAVELADASRLAATRMRGR